MDISSTKEKKKDSNSNYITTKMERCYNTDDTHIIDIKKK